eukprot:SAG31_NODE_3242_length_4504_cov_3.880817_2_plen_413_part_00
MKNGLQWDDGDCWCRVPLQDGLHSLCESFLNITLHHLDLHGVGMGPAQLFRLAAVLSNAASLPKLTSLILDRNPLTVPLYRDGDKAFGVAQYDSNLDGFIALCQGMKCCSMSKLSVAACKLGVHAMSTLANHLSGLPKLEEIILDGNAITGAEFHLSGNVKCGVDSDMTGFEALCDSLRQSSVSTLKIARCGIGPAGVLKLADTPPSLTSVDLSGNHSVRSIDIKLLMKAKPDASIRAIACSLDDEKPGWGSTSASRFKQHPSAKVCGECGGEISDLLQKERSVFDVFAACYNKCARRIGLAPQVCALRSFKACTRALLNVQRLSGMPWCRIDHDRSWCSNPIVVVAPWLVSSAPTWPSPLCSITSLSFAVPASQQSAELPPWASAISDCGKRSTSSGRCAKFRSHAAVCLW